MKYIPNRRYRPLDQLLDNPRILVLRGLNRFDWVEPADLFDAIGVAEHVGPERNTFTKALSRAVQLGHVQRMTVPSMTGWNDTHLTLVRITSSGRRQLRLELATAELAA